MYALDCGEYNDMIAWAGDGTYFKIIDRVALEKVVLPAIFKEAKCSSFLRKLYRWGFTRRRGNASSREEDLYINPLFRRGDPISCEKIRSTRFTNMINPGRNPTDPASMMHPSRLNSSNVFLGREVTSSSNVTFSSDQFPGQGQCYGGNEYIYQNQTHWTSQSGSLYHHQGLQNHHSSQDSEQQRRENDGNMYRSLEEQLLQHKILQQQLISQLNGTSSFAGTGVVPNNELNNELNNGQDSVEKHVSLDDIQSYEEEHIKDDS